MPTISPAANSQDKAAISVSTIALIALCTSERGRPVEELDKKRVLAYRSRAFFAPCARARARQVTRAVSRGGAYRQPVRARRKAAVGIDATRRLLPVLGASRRGRSPRPSAVPRRRAQLRLPSSWASEQSEQRCAGWPRLPALPGSRPFVVVRHLASKRGALRLGVVRHVESGRRPEGIMRLAHYVPV